MGVGEEATPTAATEAATEAHRGGAEARPAAGSGQKDPGSAGGLERTEKALTPRQSLTITLLRNIRYHEDRQAWFTLLNGCLNLAVLLSGTGVVATLTTKHHGWSRDIAILTAVIGATQLIFDLSRRQFQHERLRAGFLELYTTLTDANVAEVRLSAGKLYGEEPPTFFAVDTLAFNAAQKALGRPASTLRRVTLRQRLLKNVVRFTDTAFPEIGAAAK